MVHPERFHHEGSQTEGRSSVNSDLEFTERSSGRKVHLDPSSGSTDDKKILLSFLEKFKQTKNRPASPKQSETSDIFPQRNDRYQRLSLLLDLVGLIPVLKNRNRPHFLVPIFYLSFAITSSGIGITLKSSLTQTSLLLPVTIGSLSSFRVIIYSVQKLAFLISFIFTSIFK